MEIGGLGGGAAFKAKLQEMMSKAGENLQLRIGFLEGATYPDGTPVAQVAALNEYGHLHRAPKAGGPAARTVARPFFSQMLAEKSPDWARRLQALHRFNNGDMGLVMKSLGESIAQDLQMAIVNFNDPPDKDVTIAQKGFKGGAQATLQNTKVMLNSVAYEVDGERFPGPVKE